MFSNTFENDDSFDDSVLRNLARNLARNLTEFITEFDGRCGGYELFDDTTFVTELGSTANSTERTEFQRKCKVIQGRRFGAIRWRTLSHGFKERRNYRIRH